MEHADAGGGASGADDGAPLPAAGGGAGGAAGSLPALGGSPGGSQGWFPSLERLESTVDRLAMQQERLRLDFSLLWRWADEDAAPILKELGPSARAEAPSRFDMLEHRVELLEMGLAEMAHQLARLADALSS